MLGNTDTNTMSSVDQSQNTPNSEQYNLRKRVKKHEKQLSTKKNESSDEEDGEWFTSDEDEPELDINEAEFKRFLGKIFPSKNLASKIKEMDKIDKKMDIEEGIKSKRSKKKPVKEKVVEVSTESDESGSGSDVEDSEEYEEILDLSKLMGAGNEKYNIIFTMGDPLNSKRCGEDEDDDDDEYNVEEDSDYDSSSSEEEIESKSRKSSKKTKTKEKSKRPASISEEEEGILSQIMALTKSDSKKGSVMGDLRELIEARKKEKRKTEEKGLKKQRSKNLIKFKSLIRDKNVTNDFGFFNKLEISKQEKIISEVEEINKLIKVDKPYRLQLLESNIPIKFKACALKKISALRYMEPGSGEFHKVKNWVDTFMRIPFGTYTSLPINISHGVEKTTEFMKCAKETLDAAVYGLDDAKLQIMQLVGQWITNPSAIGTAIAIKGPPGTGKTTLIKEGISKILNRNFEFIALGGASDSSFLEGHSYTYEGSQCGKIVDILTKSKCMNPVIYFDELDKISETPKGEEIAGILTHLTDTSQNSQFHDKYFSEIDFDLSKCLFIFSYNDEERINPILKDRMYRIQTDGYDSKQKVVISNDYLLPKIREQVCFDESDIKITDDILSYIIADFTDGEKGVRNLKRCLEIIHTKLNLYRLMTPGTNLFEKEQSLDVSFPFEVTREVIDKLLQKGEQDQVLSSLYT